MAEFMPYLPLLRARRWALLLGWGLASLAIISSVALLGLSGWFITASALAGTSGILTFSYLFASGGVRALALSRAGARYAERLLNHRTTLSLLSALRTQLFGQTLRLDAAHLARFRSGDLLGRVLADVDCLELVPLQVVLPTLAAALAGVVACVFTWLYAPWLALTLFAALLIGGVLLPVWSALAGRSAGRALVDERATLRAQLVEAVEGRPELLAYGAQQQARTALTTLLNTSEQARARLRAGEAQAAALSVLVSGGALSAAVALGLGGVASGVLSGPASVMLALLTLGAMEAVEVLPTAYRHLGRARAAARRLTDLFGDGVDAVLPGAQAFPADFSMQLTHVSFRYPDAERDALTNLSLSLPAGRWAALLGPSGSGKSTLLGLLASELRATSGDVTLGGVPISQIAEPALRSSLTLAGQDVHLFSGTLRDNLCLAAATASDAELWIALEAACLRDVAEALPQGLETWIGEHGASLSGGQRRRLAVAQALLRRPKVLLLDEPTDGLGHDEVVRLLQGVRRTLPESSVVIATHDPSMAALCDVEVVVADPFALGVYLGE